MRASFERSELLRVLGPVAKVIESRNTMPILANILIVAKKGAVSITGTDLDIRVTATGAAQVDETGAVTVEAKKFEDIVRKLPAGAISLATEENTLIVKAGRSRFKLSTLPVDEFPDNASSDYAATFTTDLAALFKPVQYAMSDEETRFFLKGVFLHTVDGHLRAVATDGHRLARHDGPAAGEFAGVIVPRKLVPMVPPGNIEVSVSTRKIRLVADGLELVSGVIDGSFPDYQRVIPRDNPRVATIDRVALHAASDRVATISSERSRAVKFSFAAGSVALSARGEVGTAEDEIAIDYDSEPVDVGFNAAYVRDTLGAFTEERVTLRLSADGGPAVVDAGGSLLAVLMPLRVS